MSGTIRRVDGSAFAAATRGNAVGAGDSIALPGAPDDGAGAGASPGQALRPRHAHRLPAARRDRHRRRTRARRAPGRSDTRMRLAASDRGIRSRGHRSRPRPEPTPACSAWSHAHWRTYWTAWSPSVSCSRLSSLWPPFAASSSPGPCRSAPRPSTHGACHPLAIDTVLTVVEASHLSPVCGCCGTSKMRRVDFRSGRPGPAGATVFTGVPRMSSASSSTIKGKFPVTYG